MVSGFAKYRKAVELCLVACALLFLLYMGFWRHRNSVFYDHDAKFWYVAGKCWLQGISPYDHQAYLAVWREALGAPTWGQGRSFVYPPTMALIAVPMALLPVNVALFLYRMTLLTVFALTYALVLKMLREPEVVKHTRGDPWIYLALCATLYPVSVNIVQGQSSPIVIFGMVAAYYGWHRKVLFLTAIGVALACVKPQLSLPLLVYIALRRGLVPVAIGTTIAGTSATLAVLSSWTGDFLAHYAGSLEIHQGNRENTWFYYDSLPSLLGNTPIAAFAAQLGVVIACLIAIRLSLREPRLTRLASGREALRDLQILCALIATLMPLHRYDSAVYVPVVASLVILPYWWQRVLLAGAIIVHGRTWFLFTGLIMRGSDFWRGAGYASVTTGIMAALILMMLLVFHRIPSESARELEPAELR